MDVAGEPMLIRVIQRVKAITGVDEVVLATTNAEQDRALLDMAADYHVPAYAGSEDDVLERYYQTANAFESHTIVRVTGDCPLLDPEVSGRVLERFLQGDCDYASNTLKPTFPDGLDTEVFSVQALTRAWQEASLKSEREHVTPFIWKNVDKFRTANVENHLDLSALRWTVDEPEDLEFARLIYRRFTGSRPDFGMADVLDFLESHPEVASINAGFDRNEGYFKSLRHDGVAG